MSSTLQIALMNLQACTNRDVQRFAFRARFVVLVCVFQRCIRVFVMWRLMPILKFRFHRRRSCNAMCGLSIASSVLPSCEYVRSRFGQFREGLATQGEVARRGDSGVAS